MDRKEVDKKINRIIIFNRQGFHSFSSSLLQMFFKAILDYIDAKFEDLQQKNGSTEDEIYNCRTNSYEKL